ncbi:hypothetical protein [Brachybacterium sp. GPGPB12]|uniref:hypothetical protein n=1 Tax=Brachybacterium sp. GPGPB12 TaxID=3023517 RepID=UPI00313457D5
MPLDEKPHVGSADAPSDAEHPVLDNPAWSSLTGAHRALAIGNEHVPRYPEDVSPFVGVRDWEHPDVWDAILDVFGHDAVVSVSHADPLRRLAGRRSSRSRACGSSRPTASPRAPSRRRSSSERPTPTICSI